MTNPDSESAQADQSERERAITVSSFGLTDDAQEALFDRVADAAHALDEQVTCFGSLRAINESIQRGIDEAARGEIKQRDDWLADPSGSGVSTVSTFAVKWSNEDDGWVATCDLFPSLSWLASTPWEAISGLVGVME